MKIELFGDYKRSNFIEFDNKISELGITGDMFPSDSFIHVICNVKMDENIARVEGQVVSSPVLECSRCLEPFKHKVTGKFSLVVRRLKKGEVIAHNYDNDEEEDRDTLIFLSHGEDSIDITEYIHDAFLLSTPLKPLCDDHCKSLCPVCGINLNESDCDCIKRSSDPRWNALNEISGD